MAPPRPPLEARLSLGWRTDLIFARFDAAVIDRGNYLAVRTAHNPGFWWGNFLLFGEAPRAGDAAAWKEAFDAEIVRQLPACRHLTFGVDAPDVFTLPQDFRALGLTLSASSVLTQRATQLREPRRGLPAGCTIRALHLPDEAGLAVQLQVECEDGGHEPGDFRRFRERQMARYAAMQRAGLGHWFGVFGPGAAGQTPVADCGLFRDPAAPLARFQYVETHPAWRRRGLCSALVHAVCRYGYEQLGADTLVIVADPADVAMRLYESLGFQPGGSTWQLERGPLSGPSGRPSGDPSSGPSGGQTSIE